MPVHGEDYTSGDHLSDGPSPCDEPCADMCRALSNKPKSSKVGMGLGVIGFISGLVVLGQGLKIVGGATAGGSVVLMLLSCCEVPEKVANKIGECCLSFRANKEEQEILYKDLEAEMSTTR